MHQQAAITEVVEAKRVTPDHAVEAYFASGFMPGRVCYFSRSMESCSLVVALHAFAVPEFRRVRYVDPIDQDVRAAAAERWGTVEYGRDYFASLFNVWVGGAGVPCLNPREEQGRLDALACLKPVFERCVTWRM